MLLNLKEYHRPTPHPALEHALNEVLELLARTETRSVALAGGDTLLASGDDSVEAVVDLQALGLDYLYSNPSTGSFIVGAMATRTELSANETARDLASGILCEGARRWSGNVQRNRATIGGAVVVARPDDPLVVALLACDATVKLYGSKGYQTLDLDEFLQQRKNSLESPALVVEIAVPLELARRRGALALVARTPADAPIVAACAVIGAEGGRCSHVRLALGGVAETPCLAPEAAHALASRSLTPKALGEVAAVVGRAANPTGDYRGSIEYRRAMAEVLSRRALLQAAGLAE